jgi:thiol-disulfide isomerase/thioredoxin
MKWIYWLSAIIVVLALVTPDLRGFEVMRGSIPAIISILICLVAYYFAARSACAGRARGSFLPAFIAGIDVSALVAVLAYALQFGLLFYYNPGSSDLKFFAVIAAFSIIPMFIIGIISSLIAGAAIWAIPSAYPKNPPADAETSQTSLYAGRHLTSFIPHVACALIFVLVIAFEINPGLFVKSQSSQLGDLLNAGPNIGDRAPDATAKTLDGRSWRLSDQIGKVVVIDFWATNCPPCIKDLPMLQRIQKEYAEQKDFVFVSVSVDTDRSALEQFLLTHAMPWPVLFENGSGFENKFARKFEVYFIPSLWVIDKKGRIAAKHVETEKELRSKIAESLAQ